VSRPRIAVLASGGGSNLQSLLDYFAQLGGARAGDVVLVASDRPDSGALKRARAANIRAVTIISSFTALGDELDAILERHSIDIIVLAGFLQLVSADITRRYAGRMVNVHPAPLPQFGGPGMYGKRAHRAVLASGVRMSGPTAHFVDEEYDHGAVIAHWPVPVREGDDEQALADRVLRAEHLLFPRVVQAVAAGELPLLADGRLGRSFLRDDAALTPFDPELDDATLGRQLDAARAERIDTTESRIPTF
jgi:formyltetrahydrofolate-dependent phosphoribosylglycinamide formyltransferase